MGEPSREPRTEESRTNSSKIANQNKKALPKRRAALYTRRAGLDESASAYAPRLCERGLGERGRTQAGSGREKREADGKFGVDKRAQGGRVVEWTNAGTSATRARQRPRAKRAAAIPRALRNANRQARMGHLRRRGRVGRSEAQEAREEQASTTIEKNWPVSAALALRSLFHSESSCRDLWALPSRLRASALAPASDERAGLTESSASS